MLNKFYKPTGTIGIRKLELTLDDAEKEYGERLRNGDLFGKPILIGGKRYLLIFIKCDFLRDEPVVEFTYEEKDLFTKLHRIETTSHPNCRSAVESIK